MSQFESGTLEWNPQDLARAMKIGLEHVADYFTDGRRVSFIIERRIASEVIRGTLAKSEGAGFDLSDSKGGKWEVRSITRGGVYFCPSNMVGKGRKFERGGFLNKLEEIKGYILADVVSFPRAPYWIVPVNHVLKWWNEGTLGQNSHISREKILKILSPAQ